MKNLLKWLILTRSITRKSSKGFTLIELLVAASMTLIVVGAAGFALMAILKNNKVASATSEIQYDYNRAVEFISDELRSAEEVLTNLSDLPTKSPDFDYIRTTLNASQGERPVLAFRVEGSEQWIVYYLQKPDSTWAGDLVLERWGPPFKRNGTYSKDCDDDGDNNDATCLGDDDDGDGKTNDLAPPKHSSGDRIWQGNVLVDLVLTTWEQDDHDKRRCRRRPDTPEGWIRLPVPDADYNNANDSSDQQIKGFFICVPTDGALKARQTELHAYARVESPIHSPITYGADSLVMLRGGSVVSTIRNGSEIMNLNIASRPPALITDVSLNGIKFEVVNQEDPVKTCPIHVQAINPRGVPVFGPADLGVPISQATSIPTGSEIFVSLLSKAGACNGVASTSTTGKAMAAGDGVTLRDIIYPDPLNPQDEAADIQKLTNILGAKGLVNDGKLKLNSNEILVFLEDTLRNRYSPDARLRDPNLDDVIVKITLWTP